MKSDTVGTLNIKLHIMGKQFDVVGIAQTVEQANAICEETGGGVCDKCEKGIFIAAMTGTKSPAFDFGPDKIDFANGGCLTIESMNKVFQILDILESDAGRIKGPGGQELVQIAHLPDGRAIYGPLYGALCKL